MHRALIMLGLGCEQPSVLCGTPLRKAGLIEDRRKAEAAWNDGCPRDYCDFRQ